MINNVVLVGRITRDPELRYTPNNIATVSFSIAVDRGVQSQSGERQADFINCVAWRQSAEFMSKYIKKGYMIGVTGRIQTRQYQSQDGQTRYVTEVVCDSVQNLQPRDNTQMTQGQPNYNQQPNQYQQPSYNQYQGQKQNQQDTFNVSDVSEDDLPF
ncbi:MAG: single-stranded DNA-binding protein [Anaeroplasmataceae bacterium]